MGLSDPNTVLRAMPILRAVPVEELAALPTERVERGAERLFFAQGSPADAAWGILTGRVRIVKSGRGGKAFCLDVLGPGDLVGVVALIRKVPMPAAAIAVEPTACLRIPEKEFRELLERHPQVGVRILEAMSRRLLAAGDSRLSLATDEVEVRVARALLRMAEKFGAERNGEVVFSQTITRQNIADLAGTTVESTIRVMSRWTKSGLVRAVDSRITIARPDEIAKLAESAG